MQYVFLSIALLCAALALFISMDSRKKERWGCLREVSVFLLYFLAFGFFAVTALQYPEALPNLDELSNLIPQTTVQPTPTLPPLTSPPETEPPITAPREPGWYYDEYGDTYYIDNDGSFHTGWLKLEGETFYFREDGTMVCGEAEIDGKTYHFASRGQRIILVNPWNSVPEDYHPDLVTLSSQYCPYGHRVDRSCYEALIAMIDDCNAQASRAAVISGYRSHEDQTKLFSNKVNKLINAGMSEEDARIKAATSVAVPGTSEHQLGLAVDIVDNSNWSLTSEQAKTTAQQWLMEHCWEYGFILRYPEGTTEVTGIIYEPWHYRYVGKELAAELRSLDITLEEYLHLLTEE